MSLTKPCLCLLLAGLLVSGCKSISHSDPEFIPPPATVVFSFDDGPNAWNDTTARLLDVLKKYEICAMFALLGENAERHPDLVRRIYDEGHYIINHGYLDKWARGMKGDVFRDNLIKGEAAITAALLGQDLRHAVGLTPEEDSRPKLYRPHGGFYNSKQEKICREEGFTIIPAGIRVYDAVLAESKQGKVFNETIKKIRQQNGGLVLLHDARGSHYRMEENIGKKPNSAYDRSWLPDTVERIIITLLDQGFVLGSPELVIPNNP
jgi:peptidoglycan/xylan/chitin deacetylase (PgdA/CDA1 family)